MAQRPEVDIAEREPEVAGNLQQEAAESSEYESPLDGNEELQNALIAAIRKHNTLSKVTEMAAVQAARDSRLYMRGVQNFFWNEDAQDVVFGNEDGSPYNRTFNITQAYGKIFISTFMGAKPKVEPEADNIFSASSISDASKARDYERLWRKRNDMSALQMEIGRLFFTDGRIITISEDVTDGDDPGQYTRLFGVLESRAGAYLSKVKDWPIFETEDEFSLVAMKRKYPEKRKKLNSGAGDSYYRNARMAVKRRAGTDTAIDIYTGDDGTGMCTITHSYLRPDFYEHLQESDREEIEQMFPEGMCLVRNGDTYLESYSFDIDAHVDVIYAIPADGANTPAIVDPLMPVQDSVNTGMNLSEETFDHGIPTTYWDQETNIDSLNQDRNMPGASRKMVRRSDTAAEDHFFITPRLDPSPQQIEYTQNLQGPFAQFVTGLPPAIQGFGDEDQKTASGYAQMRQMALGQMAIVWKPFTSWYTREMTRSVKLASASDVLITGILDPLILGANRRAVKIEPHELNGFKFTNASDENFPETYTERRNAFMTLMSDPDAKQWILQEPDNLYLAKGYIGLPDLTIPGEDSRNKQLREIAEMETQSPVPDPEQMPDQPLPAVGAPPVPVPEVSSIRVSKYDNDEVEYKECLRWINSAEGQEAKRIKPSWYQDVCLHADEHEAQMKQKAQQNAPPPEHKPPSVNVSIPIDKVPPEYAPALLQLAGVQPVANPQVTVAPQGGIQ